MRDFLSQKVPTELLKVEHAKIKPASMSVSSTFLGMQERACNFYHFLTVPGDEWVASHHEMLPCIISPIPLQGTDMTMACSIGCNLCRVLPWTQQMTQLQPLLLILRATVRERGYRQNLSLAFIIPAESSTLLNRKYS